MAYGKIKLDTITWDNSGTDTDITVSTIPTAAQLAVKADINDPTLTGVVTVPTPSASDNSTKAASTAYVQTELGDYVTTTTGNSTYQTIALAAPKADPSLTGTLSLDGSYQQAFDVITPATSPAIDCALGNYFTLDLSSTNVSGGWDFTNVPTTKSFALAIEITTGASTTIIWNVVSVNGGGNANTIKWAGGAVPSFTQGKPLVVILTTDDTGVSWYGSALVDFATV